MVKHSHTTRWTRDWPPVGRLNAECVVSILQAEDSQNVVLAPRQLTLLNGCYTPRDEDMKATMGENMIWAVQDFSLLLNCTAVQQS